MREDTERVDERVRVLCSNRAFDEATTLALRHHGGEVFRFMHMLQRNEADTSDAFSRFAEDFWKSLVTFAWQCSLRTWMYTLARRAAFDAIEKKRRSRTVALESSEIAQIADQVRTETISFLKTEKKSRLRALRDSLSPEDRALLVLRVDRGLPWEELVHALADDVRDAEGVKREAARLRKRFQLVKEKLKALAKKEGLYASRGGDDES
jgi:RNA polymerase sigma-70 factor (ECF subfamily)